MAKTVFMMMAHLTTAIEQQDVMVSHSKCILLLDFRKAYNTVDRDFLYETMRLLGFDLRFVNLFRRTHTCTNSVVNLGTIQHHSR